MISLSASELTIIHDAAAPLDCRQRDAFVEAVMTALEGCPELGPGVIHRVIRAHQRQYWDPPLLRGLVGHVASRSKLRSAMAAA